MRSLFQVNVEEGRHLWAMVYLLHSYFGADGRDEAEALLERRSGNEDSPRILEAFNEPIETGWTSSASRRSPIVTASTSWRRWPSRASTRCAHLDAVHADRGGLPHADRRERRGPHHPPRRRISA
jgi:hypothetical protein